jgi:hypothetical protein
MSDIKGFADRVAEIVERIGPGEAGEPTSSITIHRMHDELVVAHFTPSATLDVRTISRTLALVTDTVADEAGVSPREVRCKTSHPNDGPCTYRLAATIEAKP